MLRHCKHNSRRAGFSLMEILIVVALFLSVLIVVVSLRGNIATLDQLVGQKLQSRGDIEQALQIMATEIRSAGPSSLGSYPIELASSTQFVFYSDIDKDGLYERVRYFLSSTTIIKGVIRPIGNPLSYASSSEIFTDAFTNIISGSSTVLFRYFDANYTGTSSPLSYPLNTAAVRMVNVSFLADVNASTSPKPEYFTETVSIRNLRTN